MRPERIASIKKVAIHIPSKFITSTDLSQISCGPEKYIRTKLGITSKCIAQEEEKATDLAMVVAEQIIKGEDLKNIDLVIWTGTGKKDHDAWSASSYIINELSLENAWGFDLFAQSAGDIIALRIAKNIIESSDNIKNILLVGGHKISQFVDYFDRDTSFLMNFADGASSVLIEVGSHNNILGSSTITDGSFSSDIILEKEFKNNGKNIEIEKFRLKNKKDFKSRLNKISIKNYCKTILNAKRNCIQQKEIEFVGINHLSPDAHATIMNEVGVPLWKSRYLEKYGHVGCADAWLSLGIMERDNALKANSLICLAAAGFGYVWSAICIDWSKKMVEIL